MEAEPELSTWKRMMSSPAFRSLMLFSAFRAVYGMGILIVTYFLATSGDAPLWVSVVFLLFSMVFSRILFKFIKKKWAKEESQSGITVSKTVI